MKARKVLQTAPKPHASEPLPKREHPHRPERERELTRHLNMEVPSNEDPPDRDPVALTRLLDRMRVDMSEADREGDEMSGDSHSSGLQGDLNHTHTEDGLPGEETKDDAAIEQDLDRHRLDG